MHLEQNRAWLSLVTAIVLLFFVATPALAHALLEKNWPVVVLRFPAAIIPNSVS